MNVIRIPTKFARSIKRLSDKERLSVFDSLLKIGEDEVIKLPDSAAWDLVELIYWEWMNMESRNWWKPSINHISESLGTNSPSYSAPIIEYNRVEENRIEETKGSKEPRIFSPIEQKIIDFVDHRKKIKKPMTKHALELLTAKLQKIAPWNTEMKIQILDQSILSWWSDVFPLREEENKPKSYSF